MESAGGTGRPPGYGLTPFGDPAQKKKKSKAGPSLAVRLFFTAFHLVPCFKIINVFFTNVCVNFINYD